MILKVKPLSIEAGQKRIIILNKEDAKELGVHLLDRVEITYHHKTSPAIFDISNTISRGEVGVYQEVQEYFRISEGDMLQITPGPEPDSIKNIKKRFQGRLLNPEEITSIIKDVVEHRLSEVELTAFISSLSFQAPSTEEIVALSKAMCFTGETFKLNKKIIADKHSLGGVPGDKTTLLVVPIIAAAGLTIPKTSSRAITSPAGTADRVECLCPVNLSIKEIKRVIAKTNACLAWGGAVNLAPADDLFIQIERPLGTDPLLLPSIMSKKKAAGVTHLVIDIPTGRGTKIKTIGAAQAMAGEFIKLGNLLGIKVECGLTFGEQPVGYALGPALEAREALQAFITKRGPTDLIEKSTQLAGILMEMTGIKNGKKNALEILQSGKAEQKLREIIAAQGGNKTIQPKDIPIGKYKAAVRSNFSGTVMWISNQHLVSICQAAGTPNDKGAGILLKKKIKDTVKKGEVLFEIYAEKNHKLEAAITLAKGVQSFGIAKGIEEMMFISKVAEINNSKKWVSVER